MLHILRCRMLHMSTPRSDVLVHVATNLRQARKSAGLSQTELADRAGISRRTVINLEAGDANISLSSLDTIALALGRSFTDLVRPPVARDTDLSVLAWRGAGESSATLLSSVPATHEVQLWTWILDAHDRYDAQPDPAGWHEIVTVHHGRLIIEQAGPDMLLETGESRTYPSDRPYAYSNPDDTPTRFTRLVVD